MDNKKPWYEQANLHLKNWLEEIKETELLDINEFLQQSKENLVKAEQLSEEKISQFINNMRHDLSEFYQQSKVVAKHSIYLSLLAETWWQHLADMTDRSQVEWAELAEDIQHHGEYKVGDVIGFGILQCQKCCQNIHITHMSEVAECVHCGHDSFNRVLLEP